MPEQLIEPKAALETVLKHCPVLPAEEKLFWQALNYVLATDVVANDNIPPFANSAMDGFAVQAQDIASATAENQVALQIVAEQSAGKSTAIKVEAGTAIKIMTGAPIPEGANCVVPVELCRQEKRQVFVLQSLKAGANIRNAGEDIAKGQAVLRKGHKLQPVDIGILAALGQTTVAVIKKPTVAIVGTGDELVDVAATLEPGKIRDSNSHLLTAQALNCGVTAQRLGVAKDTYASVKEKITKALTYDVIVTSGGVSVGEYDFVKAVLKDIGAEQHFWGVKQKPGKPFAFWTYNRKLIFGLPGNPIASLVCFEEYVRPALLKMSGYAEVLRPVVKARLTQPFKKKPGRQHFVGVRLTKKDEIYYATVPGRQGSGILTSFSGANGIAVIPKDVSELAAGETVEVQVISD
jgi:molybdopterin molybdotransferase